MRLWPARRRDEIETLPARSLPYLIQQVLTSFTFDGTAYTLPQAQQEDIQNFQDMARYAYKSDGVVFACIDVRAKLFSEAKFRWRNPQGGLFGSQELRILEEPWPGGTTGDLLYRLEQYGSLAGNAFVVNRGDQLAFLRPDWVDIVAASPSSDASVWDLDAEVIGYVYHPRGRHSGYEPVTLRVEEVAHYAPIPDPEARFRGMSWITPVIREIQADKAATDHKAAFFENAATPNMIMKTDFEAVDKLKPWMDLFREQHEGSVNAYRTLFVGAGQDPMPVGSTFEQMDFKVTQGAGETRIAAAASVPPVIVGLSEGLQAATYSNYNQARRRFADQTMRPLWRNVCGSLDSIIPHPNGGATLWYDDRDIPALKDDIEAQAKQMQELGTAANQLVMAGYTRDSIVTALAAGDFTLLVPDPEQPSVQLQSPPSNGNSAAAPVPAGANGTQP